MKKCKFCGHTHDIRGFACRVCKNGLYRYKMTRVDQLALYESQNKKCALCDKDVIMFDGQTGIDHCHDTNKIRGILCRQCNTFLGYFEEKLTMEKMSKYLTGFSAAW